MNFQDYQAARERHPNMLLLFRSEGSYSACGEEAHVVGKILNIGVTMADQTVRKFAKVTFPSDRLQECLQRLLKAGHRVAICEPVTDQTDQHHQPSLFDDV